MSEELKVFLNDLQDGKTKYIRGSFTSDFLAVEEPELDFPQEVEVDSKVYLAGSDLMVHVSAATAARMPCRICNKPTLVPLEIQGYYHSEPKHEISSGIVNLGSILRQQFLLELPQFAECDGDCPERECLKAYVQEKKEGGDEDLHHPFADLSLS